MVYGMVWYSTVLCDQVLSIWSIDQLWLAAISCDQLWSIDWISGSITSSCDSVVSPPPPPPLLLLHIYALRWSGSESGPILIMAYWPIAAIQWQCRSIGHGRLGGKRHRPSPRGPQGVAMLGGVEGVEALLMAYQSVTAIQQWLQSIHSGWFSPIQH